jgi:hypothetical protein
VLGQFPVLAPATNTRDFYQAACDFSVKPAFVRFERKSKSTLPTLGVKKQVPLTANFVKRCNCFDKPFTKKGSESRQFFDQILWRGVWD